MPKIKIRPRKIVFRQAEVGDVESMAELINFNAKKGIMLPKNSKQILEALFNYLTAVKGKTVVGVCGVKIWIDGSVEIVSLATLKRYQGQGIAKRLIGLQIERCRRLGFKKFFAMTVAPEVFTKLNFKKINYKKLPLKVWLDCSACPRNAAGPGDKKCNETAIELSYK